MKTVINESNQVVNYDEILKLDKGLNRTLNIQSERISKL
jgi:hypothetical protein